MLKFFKIIKQIKLMAKFPRGGGDVEACWHMRGLALGGGKCKTCWDLAWVTFLMSQLLDLIVCVSVCKSSMQPMRVAHGR